jgi:hypothetical protein
MQAPERTLLLDLTLFGLPLVAGGSSCQGHSRRVGHCPSDAVCVNSRQGLQQLQQPVYPLLAPSRPAVMLLLLLLVMELRRKTCRCPLRRLPRHSQLAWLPPRGQAALSLTRPCRGGSSDTQGGHCRRPSPCRTGGARSAVATDG